MQASKNRPYMCINLSSYKCSGVMCVWLTQTHSNTNCLTFTWASTAEDCLQQPQLKQNRMQPCVQWLVSRHTEDRAAGALSDCFRIDSWKKGQKCVHLKSISSDHRHHWSLIRTRMNASIINSLITSQYKSCQFCKKTGACIVYDGWVKLFFSVSWTSVM